MSPFLISLPGTILFALGLWMAWRDRYVSMPVLLLALVVWIVTMIAAAKVDARDLGQWEAGDPAIRAWYHALMQPDVPNASCCGEADAYWCDEIHVRDGKAFCAITDDREDAPRGRPHRELGAQYEIPPNKLKWDKSNPTGHSIIFLSRQDYVFCFVQASGA